MTSLISVWGWGRRMDFVFTFNWPDVFYYLYVEFRHVIIWNAYTVLRFTRFNLRKNRMADCQRKMQIHMLKKVVFLNKINKPQLWSALHYICSVNSRYVLIFFSSLWRKLFIISEALFSLQGEVWSLLYFFQVVLVTGDMEISGDFFPTLLYKTSKFSKVYGL